MRTLTQLRLMELLDYDPESGFFTWLVSKGRVRSGDLAGCVTSCNGKKYRKIRIDGNHYYSHRLAWLWVHGKWPSDEVDHVNGDGLDNRIANLRAVTRKVNGRNMKMPITNTSGVAGVYYCKRDKLWSAQGRDLDGKIVRVYTGKSKSRAVFWRKVFNLEHEYHHNHGRGPRHE